VFIRTAHTPLANVAYIETTRPILTCFLSGRMRVGIGIDRHKVYCCVLVNIAEREPPRKVSIPRPLLFHAYTRSSILDQRFIISSDGEMERRFCPCAHINRNTRRYHFGGEFFLPPHTLTKNRASTSSRCRLHVG